MPMENGNYNLINKIMKTKIYFGVNRWSTVRLVGF
jgi:hypothetical protein